MEHQPDGRYVHDCDPCRRQRDLRVVEKALIVGFGWSFYGFFVAAALWMAFYFIWAFGIRDSGGPHR